MKVLIFGQSGAGKTTLCEGIEWIMGDRVVHINADQMRHDLVLSLAPSGMGKLTF